MALSCGQTAPDFALTSTNGKQFILSEVLTRGPAVLFFFKISCPVCQFTAPYFERLWQIHKTEPCTVLGISQDSKADTEKFIKQFGLTFPVALDDPQRYIASNNYKLTNVPTVYLVNRSAEIEVSSVGWLRAEVEEINLKLSMTNPAQQQFSFFKPGEEVAEFKAG